MNLTDGIKETRQLLADLRAYNTVEYDRAIANLRDETMNDDALKSACFTMAIGKLLVDKGIIDEEELTTMATSLVPLAAERTVAICIGDEEMAAADAALIAALRAPPKKAT